MSNPIRSSFSVWTLVPVCALGFLLWADGSRSGRVDFVTGATAQVAPVDPGSPTGYADGKRWLVVPEHDNATYQWIEETQRMLAAGDWRIRSILYENAPFGRAVHEASPYRWWLAGLAWVGHSLSGKPLALCVERSALYADPALHVVLLLSAALFVAWRFSAFSAALLSLGLAAMFPLAGAFIPGVAKDLGLELALTLWSVLLLVAGATSPGRNGRWFIAAGIAGGCGLWLSAREQVPIIVGIAAGGFLAASLNRNSTQGPPALPWRAWAMGGAVTSLLAYLIEYFPGHMDMELAVNSPLYGLAWLGLGELLSGYALWLHGKSRTQGLRLVGSMVLAAAAVAAVPLILWRTGSRGFLLDDLHSSRLTDLPDGVVAPSLSAWFRKDGATGVFAAACAPILLFAPAVWLLIRGRSDPATRSSLAITLGPAAVALCFSVWRLSWWSSLDVLLLALLVATTLAFSLAPTPGFSRWAYGVLMGVILAFGIVPVAPPAAGGSSEFKFTRAEVEGLYERRLAHWIADHAGPDGATVFAPPYRTSSFCFYGNLKGIGTQSWENADGLSADLHIVTAMAESEARAVISQRGVTHIVLPSWDTDLDDFARLRLKNPDDAFVTALRKTDGGIFSWLRPLPYELPPVPGFEDRSVLVLAVTDDADPATMRSRLVEYLIEMHQVDEAAYASQTLLHYPGDLGSQVALAQLALARGDREGFNKVFSSIVSGLSRGSDRTLAWDRRVSLAVVLALGGRANEARAQVQRCARETDEASLRSLTTESLYHLLVLGRRYDVDIGGSALRPLCLRLLPEKVRSQF